MMLEAVNAVAAQFKTKQDQRVFLDQQIASLTAERQQYEAEHRQRVTELVLDQKSVEVVKRLIDRVAQTGTDKLAELVTHGLQTVFTDDTYSLVIETSERGNQKEVELFILDSRGVKTRLERCGGGPRVIVSLIVQIYMLVRLGLARVIVLDEVLDRVSSNYAEGLMELLRESVEQLGFKYLIVSHRPEYVDFADQVLWVQQGKVEKIK